MVLVLVAQRMTVAARSGQQPTEAVLVAQRPESGYPVGLRPVGAVLVAQWLDTAVSLAQGWDTDFNTTQRPAAAIRTSARGGLSAASRSATALQNSAVTHQLPMAVSAPAKLGPPPPPIIPGCTSRSFLAACA